MDAGRGWTRLILFGSACQHVGHNLIKKKVYDTLRSTRGARRRFVCERPVCWHVFCPLLVLHPGFAVSVWALL